MLVLCVAVHGIHITTLASGVDLIVPYLYTGFPDALVVKNLPANTGDTGDLGSIPGSERSPGGGNGNLLQYSCLDNPMDRGAWWATVHGVAKGWTL